MEDEDKTTNVNADDEPTGDTKGQKETEVYLGSWKTKDEAEKGLKSLTEKLTSQGDELGKLRKQTSTLTETLSKLQAKGSDTTEKKAPASNDLDSVLGEFGSIDFYNDDNAGKKAADVLKKAITATAEMVRKENQSEVKNILQEKDIAAMESKFMEEHPDFKEFQDSGAFEPIKAKNPFHDDFSAYFALKSDQSMQKVSELETALAEAKKTADLAGGDEQTSKVFTKPGSRFKSGGKKKTGIDRYESAAQAVLQATGRA